MKFLRNYFCYATQLKTTRSTILLLQLYCLKKNVAVIKLTIRLNFPYRVCFCMYRLVPLCRKLILSYINRKSALETTTNYVTNMTKIGLCSSNTAPGISMKSLLLPLHLFNGPMSRTTQVSRYRKKHSPTHTYRDHQSSFISFIHLIHSICRDANLEQ